MEYRFEVYYDCDTGKCEFGVREVPKIEDNYFCVYDIVGFEHTDVASNFEVTKLASNHCIENLINLAKHLGIKKKRNSVQFDIKLSGRNIYELRITW